MWNVKVHITALLLFFSSFCIGQDSVNILFRDVKIPFDKNALTNSFKINDTLVFIHRLDSLNYLYIETCKSSVANFGNLVLFKFGRTFFLMRSGLWKNTECGDFFEMSNEGSNGILSEYCLSKNNEIYLKKRKKNKL